MFTGILPVALRKESVDRNPECYSSGHRQAVALRKESVDRNKQIISNWQAVQSSLSVRRAWIEIGGVGQLLCLLKVALRKESVDRNDTMEIVVVIMRTSLSVRRAWIEISRAASCQQRSHQSLSVRRAWIEIYKYSIPYLYILSLSVRRAWIEIGCAL